MNVLFIYSQYDIVSFKKPLRDKSQIQLGISYISSCLKQHGHSTRLLVLSRVSAAKNLSLILDTLEGFNPEVVAFTSVSTEYEFITMISRFIRRHKPEVYQLIGGPHVSLNPRGVLKDYDALCIGEGEYPTLELVSQLQAGGSPKKIENLWFRDGSKIVKNRTRPFVSDLDALPFPDREMWDEWIVDGGIKTEYPLLAGRGCPYSCTYCCNHALNKIAKGDYVRFRSPENIIAEIKELVRRYPDMKEISLEIESFGMNLKWALSLCDYLDKFNMMLKKPLAYGANLRIEHTVDYERLFSALRKSNFRYVCIGLEAGSERIRRDVLRREYTNKDLKRAVAIARKYGLKVFLYSMIGIPGETVKDLKKTIRVNRECSPDRTLVSIFYPYPGTDLYRYCKKMKLLPKRCSTEGERKKAVLDLPGFSKQQIDEEYAWFEYNVYRGSVPTHELMRSAALKMNSIQVSNEFTDETE